jgi:hypothetical protein
VVIARGVVVHVGLVDGAVAGAVGEDLRVRRLASVSWRKAVLVTGHVAQEPVHWTGSSRPS